MTSGSSPEGGAPFDPEAFRLWNQAIEMEDWSTAAALEAQQRMPVDEWFLGPEGYAAFEASVIANKEVVTAEQVVLGGISNPRDGDHGWRKISNNSLQLAADKGTYWDF